jgi:hypothetical protein
MIIVNTNNIIVIILFINNDVLCLFKVINITIHYPFGQPQRL